MNHPHVPGSIAAIKSRPRVYCASPYPRAKMWRLPGAGILGPDVAVSSTWHDLGLDESQVTDVDLAAHWMKDFFDIRQSDVLLAYAEAHDKPQGTLVEIGYALGHEMYVYLVGNYPWGNFRNHPLVKSHSTIREAVIDICRDVPLGTSEGSSA